MTSDNIKSGLYLAAILGAGYIAFQGYKKSTKLADGAAELWAVGTQKIEQASADVQSAWVNNVSAPYQRGRDYADGVAPIVSSKAWLYADYAYTGQDADGQLITDSEWYRNPDARRYDAAQPPAAKPTATSNNGAAFGVYPSAFGSNGISQKRAAQ